MTKLSVNLNAVAQLRNRRNLPWPSVVGIARIALESGADGITVHPRPDERHIRRPDVFELERMLRTEFPLAEYNIEGYPTPEFLDLVEEAHPDQVTFVPDEPGQSTSDHGWDALGNRNILDPAMTRMWGAAVRIVLFIDPVPAAASAARAVGAERVELFTGGYGAAFDPKAAAVQLEALEATARQAVKVGLELNAGHDLTVDNLPLLLAAVPNIKEVSIGHALCADALIVGYAEAVRRFKSALADSVGAGDT